jgi:hypothetical protein
VQPEPIVVTKAPASCWDTARHEFSNDADF